MSVHVIDLRSDVLCCLTMFYSVSFFTLTFAVFNSLLVLYFIEFE